MGALQPFAAARDLQVLLPELATAEAQLVLELVSSSIRDSVRWPVDAATGLVYRRSVGSTGAFGVGDPGLRGLGLSTGYRPGRRPPLLSVCLPHRNVTNITAVVVDDLTLTTLQYEGETSGVVHLDVPAWRYVTVTYDAGYRRAPTDEAPGVFRAVALDLAARLGENPTGAGSYVMGAVRENLQGVRDAADGDSRLDLYRLEQ